MEWFSERYISRDEHQQIVAYYRKLVASLQCKIRDLRDRPVVEPAEVECRPKRETAERPQISNGTNVVRIDFRGPR